MSAQLAEAIAGLRARQGLSVWELSLRLDCDVEEIEAWESGRSVPASETEAVRLSDWLGYKDRSLVDWITAQAKQPPAPRPRVAADQPPPPGAPQISVARAEPAQKPPPPVATIDPPSPATDNTPNKKSRRRLYATIATTAVLFVVMLAALGPVNWEERGVVTTATTSTTTSPSTSSIVPSTESVPVDASAESTTVSSTGVPTTSTTTSTAAPTTTTTSSTAAPTTTTAAPATTTTVAAATTPTPDVVAYSPSVGAERFREQLALSQIPLLMAFSRSVDWTDAASQETYFGHGEFWCATVRELTDEHPSDPGRLFDKFGSEVAISSLRAVFQVEFGRSEETEAAVSGFVIGASNAYCPATFDDYFQATRNR